jgi:hypothetical protein
MYFVPVKKKVRGSNVSLRINVNVLPYIPRNFSNGKRRIMAPVIGGNGVGETGLLLACI